MRPWFKVAQGLAWLTQLGISLAAPLLLCIGGCWWLQQRFSLGNWILAAGIILGLGGSASTAIGFYRHFRQKAEKDGKGYPDAFNSHR